MTSRKLGALLLAGVLLLSAGYAAWLYAQPKPILPWPEETQLVQVQKVIDLPQQPTQDYEITEELEAALIAYFSTVNHRATLEPNGSYYIGQYDYLIAFWRGDRFIQIRLSDEGVTDGTDEIQRMHAIENAPQVLEDVTEMLQDAVLVG